MNAATFSKPYLKDVPLIPRMMAERAHSKTGIDIHPGARIGKNTVVGANTRIKESVPADVVVAAPTADLVFKKKKRKTDKD